MRLPDPARSRAVLIGAAHYRTMEDLPAVSANLARLAELLGQPEIWGLPPGHVVVVDEPASAQRTLDEIRQAAAAADDTLLVYYAGHGLLDTDDHLLLALPETDVQRPYTAIRFDDVRTQVRSAHRNSAKVIILDCCYSARAIAGGMSPDIALADDLKRHAAVAGTYLMAAAAETGVAVAPPGETYTAFTGELINVLEHGIDGSPDLITVDQIFWQIRGELEAKGRPRPEQGTRNEGATIVLSRNRARRRHHPAADRPPPAAVTPIDLPPSNADLIAAAAGADGDHLFRTAGAVKPDQQVAGLVLRLDDADAAKVLDGAATRPLPEIQGILDLLLSLDTAAKVELLLQRVAAGSPQRTVELAGAYPDLSGKLLGHAVEAAADGRPHWVIDLVAGLSRRGMKDAADAVVADAVVRLRDGDAAEVADALREAGRDTEAARLYSAAIPSIARRAPEQLADVVADLARQGFQDAAWELVEHAARENDTAPRRARLLRALAAEPLLVPLRTALVDTLGRDLDPTSLRKLADELGTRGDDPVELYVAAAAARPIEVLLGILDHVLGHDRVRDALRLVEWAAAKRSVDDLTRLGSWLTAPYRTGLLQRLLTGIKSVDKIISFYLRASRIDGGLAGVVMEEMLTRPPSDRMRLAVELATRSSPDVAVDLLFDKLIDPESLDETERVTLLATLAGASGLDDLLIKVAVRQLCSGRSSDWALSVMSPEAINATVSSVPVSSLGDYLAERPAGEIVSVLQTIGEYAEPAKLASLLRRLANGSVDLVAAVLSDLHRTEHEELGNQLATRYRATASEADVNEVASRLRLAGAENVAQGLLDNRLWLPLFKAGDPVATAVADFLHDVHLSGKVWRYPVEPAVVQELTKTQQLESTEICLLVWQGAVFPVRERIVFTTDRARPWRGSAVRYEDIADAEMHDNDVHIDSSHGLIVWTLHPAYLAPDLSMVLLKIRDIVRRPNPVDE